MLGYWILFHLIIIVKFIVSVLFLDELWRLDCCFVCASRVISCLGARLKMIQPWISDARINYVESCNVPTKQARDYDHIL